MATSKPHIPTAAVRSFAGHLSVVSMAVVLLLGGCRPRPMANAERLSGTTNEMDAGARLTWADLENMPEVVMAEPSIDIVAEGNSEAMVLHFRLRSLLGGRTTAMIPQIMRIAVWNPESARMRGRKPECLVQAGNPVSLGEWRYDDTPPGFSKFECNKLVPGEYVVSVQFLGGYGGIRIAIDGNRQVRNLPLKQVRSLPSKR
jgi:hypothetical protein